MERKPVSLSSTKQLHSQSSVRHAVLARDPIGPDADIISMEITCMGHAGSNFPTSMNPWMMILTGATIIILTLIGLRSQSVSKNLIWIPILGEYSILENLCMYSDNDLDSIHAAT